MIIHVQQSPDGAQERVGRNGRPSASIEARASAKLDEAVPRYGPCVDFFEIGARVADELYEPCLVTENAQIVGEACTGAAYRFAQVAEHRVLCDSVELERTSRRQEREVVLDGLLNLMARAAEQCPVADVVAVLAPHLPD